MASKQTGSPDSERYLLGAVLLDPECLVEIAAELKPGDFSETKNGMVFTTVLDMHRRGVPIDVATLREELVKTNHLKDAGGEDYIFALVEAGVTSSSWPYHVAAVKEARAKWDILQMLRELGDSLKAGKGAGEMLDEMRQGVQRMTTGGYIGIDPFEPLDTCLTDKYKQDQERDPGKLLGYALDKFADLARNIDGLQPGFYVVGAETNAGKTAFLCNLTLDLLQSNPELSGIYFSLDDPKTVIVNRLLSILTNIPLNQVQRPQRTDRHGSMLLEGYNTLHEIAKAGRLHIRDGTEIQDVRDMEQEIRRRLKGPLVVVVDALYNLDVGADTYDQRTENIERANRLKALASTFNIPVVCTGELRKRAPGKERKPPTVDDLMETGKFAYNANLVLLLYPESWEQYDQEDSPILKAKYAKNKLSHYRGTQDIRFERQTSRITEAG